MQGIYSVMGVLVAGGDGKRFSDDTPKVLMEVDGKTLLEHNMTMMSPYVDSFLIIVGKAKDRIISKIGATFDGKPIAYVIQPVQDGPLGAMRYAYPYIAGNRCIVALADGYLVGSHIDKMILASVDTSAVIGVMPNSDKDMIAQAYSVIYRDTTCHVERGIVSHVVEKPVEFPNDVRGTGYYILSPSVIEMIPDVPPRDNGQYEITDLFPYTILHGGTVRASQIADEEYNVNTKDVFDRIRRD